MLLYVLEGLHFISSWTKCSSGSARLFGWSLAAAWRGRFSPFWQKVFHTFETVTPLTLYFDPIALKLPGYSVETFRPPLKISSTIRDLIYFSIDCPKWKVLPYAFIWGKVVLLTKRNIMSLDQSERYKWSREQVQNLILHIFSHNYHNYSMFWDVPECSGMFHVPGFIDGPTKSWSSYTFS